MFRDGELAPAHPTTTRGIAEQLRTGAISEAEAKERSKFRHVITKSIGFERRHRCGSQEGVAVVRRATAS